MYRLVKGFGTCYEIHGHDSKRLNDPEKTVGSCSKMTGLEMNGMWIPSSGNISQIPHSKQNFPKRTYLRYQPQNLEHNFRFTVWFSHNFRVKRFAKCHILRLKLCFCNFKIINLSNKIITFIYL